MEKMPFRDAQEVIDVQAVMATAKEVTTSDWRQALPVLTGSMATLRELRLSDAPALLASAERSAASAHAAGGDRIESSAPPPPDESWDAVELESGLRAALAGGSMTLNGTPPASGVLHYQPIFASGGTQVNGVQWDPPMPD